MNIVVVGAGAIGCFIGAQLATHGQQVTLVGRPAVVDAIQKNGITTNRDGHLSVAKPYRATTSIADACSISSVDLVIVTVKAYDTENLAISLAPFAPYLARVLTLQNGIGNEEKLMGALGQESVFSGAITTPVAVTSPAVIEVPKAGALGIAPSFSDFQHKNSKPLAQIFSGAGISTKLYADWRALKWTKLLMNVLCNVTCAILGWTPAQVMADSRVAEIEIVAWRETLNVMKSLGVRPVSLGGYPFNYFAPWIQMTPTSILRRVVAQFVMRGRGQKTPSLHLDLLAGKQKSEVAFLNGAVTETAQRLQVAAPVNAGLTRILLEICSGNVPWNAWKNQPDRLIAALK